MDKRNNQAKQVNRFAGAVSPTVMEAIIKKEEKCHDQFPHVWNDLVEGRKVPKTTDDALEQKLKDLEEVKAKYKEAMDNAHLTDPEAGFKNAYKVLPAGI